MYKKLAYAVLFVGTVAVAAAVGCGGSGTPPIVYDFSTKLGDGGGNTDGPSTNKDQSATTYTASTPNQVDTDTIGGNFSQGTAVSMTGLIVLAPPTGFSAKIKVTGDGCRYEVYAQDPACTTPPCGIILETQPITNPAGTGQFCPYADELTTADAANVPLAKTWLGDVVNIKGVIDNFSHTSAGGDGGIAGTVNAHQIELDSLTTTATKQALPAPTPITDSATSIFTPYGGTGWAKYEGMYIKLTPASGKFTTTLFTSSTLSDVCTGVTGKTNGSFFTAPGGAYYADTYAGFYIEKEAGEVTNCWPTNGSTFSSISGIVSAAFGGSILPTTSSDFAQ